MGVAQSLNRVYPEATTIVIESGCEGMWGRRFNAIQPMPTGVTDSYKWGEFTRTVSALVRRYYTEAWMLLLVPLAVFIFIIPYNILRLGSATIMLYPAIMIAYIGVMVILSVRLRTVNMAVDREIEMTVMRYSQELGVAMQFYQSGTGMCRRKGQQTQRIIIIHPTANMPQPMGGMPMLMMQQQVLAMHAGMGMGYPQTTNGMAHQHQNVPHGAAAPPPYGAAAPPPYGAAAPPPYGAAASPPYGAPPSAYATSPYGSAPPLYNDPPPAYGSPSEPPPSYAEASQVPVAQPIYDASQPIKCWPVSFPPPGVPSGHLCFELTCPGGCALRAGSKVTCELPDGRKMDITVNKDLSSRAGSASQTMLFFAPV